MSDKPPYYVPPNHTEECWELYARDVRPNSTKECREFYARDAIREGSWLPFEHAIIIDGKAEDALVARFYDGNMLASPLASIVCDVLNRAHKQGEE